MHSVQSVVGPVRMEGPWMQEPVHVTVQMATVGIPVEVSTLIDMLKLDALCKS